MKRLLKSVAKVIGIFGILLTAVLVFIILSDQGKILLPVRQTAIFTHKEMANFPQPLYAEGNQLQDVNGNIVRLRGLMPVDPSVLHGQNRFSRRFFEEMAATGANVIRLPVHPHYWQADPDYLWRYLDQAVAWTGELGMYLIIDWHSIGNVKTGKAPLMPELYSHDWQMTLDFWTAVAQHFHNTPHVLFEIFNEPQGIGPRQWQAAATELVQAIRHQGASQVVIVGGVEYARDLRWALDNPVPDDNIAYAAHIYPLHKAPTWTTYFGQVAEEYPVLITEWGFMAGLSSEKQDFLLNGTDETYGRPFLSYLNEQNIGWIACWYDETWEPPMLAEDGFTQFGDFVMVQLSR